LGEKNAGRHAFDWDGKTDGGIGAKPGDYTFEVQASSQDGKEMQVKTSFAAKVDAITDLANGGRLDTASGKVEAKDILAIRPDTPAAPTAAAPTAAAPTAAVPAKRERPKAEQRSQADKAAAAANATRPEKPESKPVENKATDSKQNSISNVAKKAS
jgi:creatinine amidohydrolase/Fe(II)-dependent formamide hydrolase-like protein